MVVGARRTPEVSEFVRFLASVPATVVGASHVCMPLPHAAQAAGSTPLDSDPEFQSGFVAATGKALRQTSMGSMS